MGWPLLLTSFKECVGDEAWRAAGEPIDVQDFICLPPLTTLTTDRADSFCHQLRHSAILLLRFIDGQSVALPLSCTRNQRASVSPLRLVAVPDFIDDVLWYVFDVVRPVAVLEVSHAEVLHEG